MGRNVRAAVVAAVQQFIAPAAICYDFCSRKFPVYEVKSQIQGGLGGPPY